MKISSYIKLLALVCVLLLSCNDGKKTATEKVETKKTATTKIKTPLEKSIKNGRFVYNDFCINCHMANGKGVANAFPPLANSDYLKNKRNASIHALKYGLQGEITVNGKTYNSAMAAQGLDNDEIADVMNFINHSWGNDYGKMVTEKEVAEIEK